MLCFEGFLNQFMGSTCAECANSHTKCAESHTFSSLIKCYIADNQHIVISSTVFVGKIIEGTVSRMVKKSVDGPS